jgi:hypothetical protein
MGNSICGDIRSDNTMHHSHVDVCEPGLQKNPVLFVGALGEVDSIDRLKLSSEHEYLVQCKVCRHTHSYCAVVYIMQVVLASKLTEFWPRSFGAIIIVRRS